MDITNEAGIYLITNKINNKKYVGSTHNFKMRWRSHVSMLIEKFILILIYRILGINMDRKILSFLYLKP